MSDWARMYLIVPAELQEWANGQAELLDTDGGADSFSVPLSADGLEPATHYGAAGLVRLSTKTLVVDQLVPAAPGTLAYDEGDGWSWETALQDAGLKVIREEEES